MTTRRAPCTRAPSRSSSSATPCTRLSTASSSRQRRSLPLGITTALAVAAHEIPQEAGDFAILLAAGHSRGRALLLNLSSATGGIIGAAAMLAFGSNTPTIVPLVLAFAAGNFLYVAMADLIPNLHRGNLDQNAVRQVVLIVAGILTIVVL